MSETRWNIERLRRLSKKRKPGYLAAVLACAKVDGNDYVFEKDSECYRQILTRDPHCSGARAKRIASPPAKRRANPDANPGWARVASSWATAAGGARGLLANTVKFARSALSRGIFATIKDDGGDRVDARTLELRILSCHGDATNPPCSARDYDAKKKFHFCHDCGCGDRELARLDSLGSEADAPLFAEEDYLKLTYPHLECPRRRPGFSNARPEAD